MSTERSDQFDIECQLQSDALRHVHEGLIMFFSNQFVECQEFVRSKIGANPDFAHTYNHGLAMVRLNMAVFTNEKVRFLGRIFFLCITNTDISNYDNSIAYDRHCN